MDPINLGNPANPSNPGNPSNLMPQKITYVTAADRSVEILDEPNGRAPAEAPSVAGKRDELGAGRNRDGAREVGHEDERPVEHGNEDEIATGVVVRDLRPELGDPGRDLRPVEVDVSDPGVV